MEGLPDDVREKITNTEAFDLALFVPTFAPFPESVVVFHFNSKRKEWPDVKEMSFTDPRVIHIFLETYSGLFPMIEFNSFVRGVATAALIIKEQDQVKLALEKLTQAMLEAGADMPARPALPEHLQDTCLKAVADVINYTEPFNWRRMLSFVYGIFWLAGLTVKTNPNSLQKAGLKHLSDTAEHFAKLGVLPT